jgi:fructose-bisphosphate aldolase, class II
MKKVVALRMQQFGQAGHGKDYTPLPIAKMAEGYKSGALDTRPSVAAGR